MRWDADLASWTLVGDAEEYRLSEIRMAIIGVLMDTDEPMMPTEVADALGMSANTVKQRMWQMSKEGQLTNASGKYSVDNRNPHNRVTEEEGGQGYEVTPVMGYEEEEAS